MQVLGPTLANLVSVIALSWRARALCLVLALLAAGGLPAIARADGGRVDAGTMCVGDPPRQTFDPVSPPCIPFWDKDIDNGGATAKGVTPHEIRIAVLVEGGVHHVNGSDPTNRSAPRGKVYDLAQGQEECLQKTGFDPGCSHLVTEGLRVWQQYFNDRFQTYGRSLHFYAAFTSTGPGNATPQSQIADALRIDESVDPFAAVSLLSEDADQALMAELNDLGVTTFADSLVPSDEALSRLPGLAWNFGPSAQQAATTYTGFVCAKVVGQPAVRAGGTLSGRPRVLGLIGTNDPTQPGRTAAAEKVRQGVDDCGGTIQDSITFSSCCAAHDTGDLPDQELQDMDAFRQSGITTVLVAGALNSNYVRAAQALGYAPEWVMLGDGTLDNRNAYGFVGDVSRDRTIVISPQTVETSGGICSQAYREINVTTPDSDLAYTCGFYRPLFLMAMAVQLAGPTLNTTNVDAGLHAIPPRASGDPATPACWFAPGEYSCVKDAHLGRWDAAAPPATISPASRPGCFRAAEGGRRYTAGAWPAGNIDAQWGPADPCASFAAPARINLT